MKREGVELPPRKQEEEEETQEEEETWGAGVDIHTIDTRPSLCQFRTHFLVRFVPNKLPLPRAH